MRWVTIGLTPSNGHEAVHVDAWLCYDLRTYPGGASSTEMASAAIEQVAWADRLEEPAFEAVLLPEHHGAADGYDPSPFVLAGAIASRTSRIRFMMGAVLLPLHNPLRVAEDTVTLDVISGGRVTLVAGLGYVPSEFEMFGVPLGDRGRLTDEGLRTLRSAFTGEPFNYQGRTARVTPKPMQDPVPIYVGGAVPASARRAARFGDGFFPTVPTPELIQLYQDECVRHGREPGRVVTMVPPLFVHVAEDPARAWAQIAPHAVYEMSEYGRWAAESAAASASSTMDSPYQEVPSADALRAMGTHAVVTPDEAITLIRSAEADGRLVNFKPMVGGLSPDLAWQSLELLAAKVLPAITSPAAQGVEA
jgi:alkanesulfonate monooxygenase SsuD/methylene tetrahydromethanopterin reductase-like flavin-dependent oxidoreductase (luciferase family)